MGINKETSPTAKPADKKNQPMGDGCCGGGCHSGDEKDE
jgi:hypothetical protein